MCSGINISVDTEQNYWGNVKASPKLKDVSNQLYQARTQLSEKTGAL